MRVNDIVSGGLLIGGAAAMIAFTATFPAFPGQRYGPNLFPRLIGAGLILCGVLLVLRGLKARADGEALFARPAWATAASLATMALTLAIILAYVLFVDAIGFVPLSVFGIGLLFYWLGVKPLSAAALAVGSTFTVNWFFGSLMRVPLPRGLMNLLPFW
jgi:putative tricarboxylic transport membrane protein